MCDIGQEPVHIQGGWALDHENLLAGFFVGYNRDPTGFGSEELGEKTHKLLVGPAFLGRGLDFDLPAVPVTPQQTCVRSPRFDPNLEPVLESGTRHSKLPVPESTERGSGSAKKANTTLTCPLSYHKSGGSPNRAKKLSRLMRFRVPFRSPSVLG